MWRIIVGIIIFGAIAQNLMREFALSRLAVSLVLVGSGVVLYFANVILIQKYIQHNAPSAMGDWEKTAGAGIVPKWVSLIGLMSISAFIAATLPWIIAIFT